jgi:hypothetical protein
VAAEHGLRGVFTGFAARPLTVDRIRLFEVSRRQTVRAMIRHRISNIEQGMMNVEGRREGDYCVFRRANSISRSWRSWSPVSFSFIIHHSLFDIRYFFPPSPAAAGFNPRRPVR